MILTHKGDPVFFNWKITQVLPGNDCFVVVGDLEFGDQTVSGVGAANILAEADCAAFRQAATHLIAEIKVQRSSVAVLNEAETCSCCGRAE